MFIILPFHASANTSSNKTNLVGVVDTFLSLLAGILFDIAHHQSYDIRNRGMPLEREIGFFLERMARMRQMVPGRVMIVRSHVHGALRIYTEAGIAAVSTSCWKLQDEFAAISKYPNRTFSRAAWVGWFLHPGGGDGRLGAV